MNLYSDLDFEHNDPIFTQDTPANDHVPSKEIGSKKKKKISSSADMVKTVISDYINPHCDLDLENSKPIFSHDILAHAAS